MSNIDVNRIKQYNEDYKRCKEKAMQLTAERDLNRKEIESLCSELSVELGINVTLENVEKIYLDRVAKINEDLALGESIISRIKNEESMPTQTVQQNVNQIRQPQQSNITPPNIPRPNIGQIQGMGMTGVNIGSVQQPMTRNNGFASLDNMPQAEVKTEPVQEAPRPMTNSFISQMSNGQPAVIPQMFSRNGGGIPSINEDELDDIDVV